MNLDTLTEALRVGRAARTLIAHPAYLEAMQAVEAYHVSAMVACPEGPRGVDTLSHHHRMLAALRDLASELAARAEAATQAEKSQDEPEDDDEDEDL